MTMKVQEQTISIERKKHPNAVRYPCRATHEILDAVRKFLSSLSQGERDLLLQNDLVLEEEETGELFDAFQTNDIIGLGVLRSDGFHSNTYRIEKINKDEDWMECENAYTKEFEEISFQDISVGMSLGFAEILYRDDKPFGVSDSYDFTIKYEIEEIEESEESDDTNATANNNVSAESSEGISELSSEGSPDAQTTTHHPSEVSQNVEESATDLKVTTEVDFNQTYFAFGFDDESMTHYVVLTPSKLWDEEKSLCSDGSTMQLAKKLNLESLSDCMFSYDHQYNESQLRHLLVAFRSTENSNIVNNEE